MTIYTEKKTSLLWEAQLFENFAMVKMISPGFERSLKQISLEEFGRDFDEFWGDQDQVHGLVNDGPMSS